MAVSVTMRTARTLIENAIVDVLQLSYGRRYPAAADVPTLRSLPSAAMPNRAMRFVTSAGFAYQWQRFSTSTDDGVNFIQPSDVAGANPGRWALATSTGLSTQVSAGYLQKCELYNDDGHDLEVFEERLFANTPAMLLSFDNFEHEVKSIEPGALYWCRCHFTLFVISYSARGGQIARQGSPIAAEAANDPGTAAMMGDAKAALAGLDGPTGLGISDVAYVQIGNEAPVIQDLARARFVESLELTVFCTLTNPDPTIVPLAQPYAFNASYAPADLNGASAFDASNEVTSSGFQFPLGDGLNKAFAGGSMIFGGASLTVPGASRTFTANKVTYRDVNASGVMTYSETNFGDAPPPVGYGLIRVGVTATDATGVRVDRLLASSTLPPLVTDKVQQPNLVSIAISPTNISIPTGTPVQFSALGTYDDASTLDVTYLVAWASDNANTTFSPSGVANTSAPGIAHVTASLNGVASNTSTLTAT